MIRTVFLALGMTIAPALGILSWAGEISIKTGHLDTRPATYGIRLQDVSPRQFSFTGSMPPLNVCTQVICPPGSTIHVRLGYGGSDGPSGEATLDGISYHVDNLGYVAYLSLDFSILLDIPEYAATATAPGLFEFTGSFGHYVPGVGWTSDRLSGGGVATMYLTGNPAYPIFDRSALVLEFATADVPPPWQSTAINAFDPHLTGAAPAPALVVVGAGTDIFWGGDSFQYLSQPLQGDGDIVARLRGQSSRHPFAKAGVMIREDVDSAAPHVLLDVKPDGGVEFMARSIRGDETLFVAGAVSRDADSWLWLRRVGDRFTGFISDDGAAWTDIGSVIVPMPPLLHAGLAVTSHDAMAVNRATFDNVLVAPQPPTLVNLLVAGDFEIYDPPSLGPPGWLSDDPYRQSPAIAEVRQPHTGTRNGACRTTVYRDCGIYQELRAPADGRYRLTFYATADRAGGLVGANVNDGLAATANVLSHVAGVYGEPYVMFFPARQGDLVRVWMYSPAIPGYIVIDDVSLTLDDDVLRESATR